MIKSASKKGFALILTLLMLLGALTVNATSTDEVVYLLGDSNEDSVVNIKDATAVQKHIADIAKLSVEGQKLSDVDASKNINIKDATAIQKWIAGITVDYPINTAVDISGADLPDTKDIVVDAYSYKCTHSPSHSMGLNTYSYRIPHINLDLDIIDSINEEIWSAYSFLEDIDPCSMTEDWSLFSLDYGWGFNGDIFSFYISKRAYLYTYYESIYNISVSTGKVMSDTEVIQYAGYTEEEYRNRMKEVLASGYIEHLVDTSGESFVDKNLYFFSYDIKQTLTDENLDKFTPVLNQNGELCIIGYMYYPAGRGLLDIIYNLDTHEVNQNYLDIVAGLY